MYVQPDSTGPLNIGAPYVAPPIKRAPVSPAQQGDRAQEDRRENQSGTGGAGQNKAVFRSLLANATAADLTRELGRQPDAATLSASEFIRPEKRPVSEPAALSNEDVTAAYSYLTGQSQSSRLATDEVKQAGAEAERYAAASAAYVQSSFEITPAFAAKGEVLELQA